MSALVSLLIAATLGVTPPVWTSSAHELDGPAGVWDGDLDRTAEKWSKRPSGPVTFQDLGMLYRAANGPEVVEVLDQRGTISRADSVRLAELRDKLHERTLRKLAERHGEFTVLDAGRGGTARSDLDFTLVGDFPSHTRALVNDYAEIFREVCKANTGSALSPSRLGIAPFDGELFFPDPLHSGLTTAQYTKRYADMLKKMSLNPEALASEGTFTTQVIERARAGDDAFKAGLRERPVLRTITAKGPAPIKPSMRSRIYRERVPARRRLAFAFDAAATYLVASRAHSGNPEKTHKYLLRTVDEGGYVQFATKKGLKAQAWGDLTPEQRRAFVVGYHLDGVEPRTPKDMVRAVELQDAYDYAAAMEERTAEGRARAQEIARRRGKATGGLGDGATTAELQRAGRDRLYRAASWIHVDTLHRTIDTRVAELGSDSKNLRAGARLALTHLLEGLRSQPDGLETLERLRARRWPPSLQTEVRTIIDGVNALALVEDGKARGLPRVALKELRNDLLRALGTVASGSTRMADAWRAVRRGQVKQADVRAWAGRILADALAKAKISRKRFEDSLKSKDGKSFRWAVGTASLAAGLGAIEAWQQSDGDPGAVMMALAMEALSTTMVGSAVLAVGAGMQGDPGPAALIAPMAAAQLSGTQVGAAYAAALGHAVLVVSLSTMTVRIVGHALLRPIEDQTVAMYITGVKPKRDAGWFSTGTKEGEETAFDSILSVITPDSYTRWHEAQQARKFLQDMGKSRRLQWDDRRLLVYDHLRPRVAAEMKKAGRRPPPGFVDFEPWVELALDARERTKEDKGGGDEGPLYRSVEETPSWTPYHDAWARTVPKVVRRWVLEYLSGSGEFVGSLTPSFREFVRPPSEGAVLVKGSRSEKVAERLTAILLSDYHLVERHVLVTQAIEGESLRNGQAMTELEEAAAAFSQGLEGADEELLERFGDTPHLPDPETEPQEAMVVRARAWLEGQDVRVSVDVLADDRVHPPPFSVTLQATEAPRGKKNKDTPKGQYRFDLKVTDGKGVEIYSQPFNIHRELKETPFGVVERHHPNGKLHKRWFTIPPGNKYGGMKEGLYESFYPSGARETVGEFFLDKRTGRWRTYFDHGSGASRHQEKRTEDYDASTGQIDRHTEYYPNGDLLETMDYSVGRPYAFQAYLPKGQTNRCPRNWRGKLPPHRLKGNFDRQGRPHGRWSECHGSPGSRGWGFVEAEYMDGHKHGVWRAYGNNRYGDVIARWEYSYGQLIEKIVYPSVVDLNRSGDLKRPVRYRYQNGRQISREVLDRMPY